MYDFHSHTLASDGGLTATELLQRAYDLNIQHFAITDHDSIASCGPGSTVAKELGIAFYNGVEISAIQDNKEYHIVGLNIDLDNDELNNVLASNAEFRRIRAKNIAAKLPEKFRDILHEWMQQQPTDKVVCRSHIARLLVEAGIEKNAQLIFKRWLGRKGRAFVRAEFIELTEVVRAIKAAGGVAVIAHPLKYEVSKKQLWQLCAEFKVAGGHGIEIVYSGQTPGQIDKLCKLAEEFGFSGSVGSDFHYPTPWNQMGKLRPLPATIQPVWKDFINSN